MILARDARDARDSGQGRRRAKAGGARTPVDRARRTLSQGFLVDRHAIDLVVTTAGPAGLVLEPGAGAGAGAHVIGPHLAQWLAARTRGDTGIEVVRGDFTAAPAPGLPFAVARNIPYAATSKNVNWCLRAPSLTSATLARTRLGRVPRASSRPTRHRAR